MKKKQTVTGNTESKKLKKSKKPAPPEKTRQHGPQKEKVQITVRIDKELMDQVYAQIKQTNVRITDMLERGLVLAMQEQDQSLPLMTAQVRFLVANTTKAQQARLRRFFMYMALEELAPIAPDTLLIRKQTDAHLEQLERHPDSYCPDLYKRTVELFSRYGRTPEEIVAVSG